MADKIEEYVIGYRWLCSRGTAATDQCGELHGQEFYKNPEPGQRPVDEMPERPLHPNCRCTRLPIFDFEVGMLKRIKEVEPKDDENSPVSNYLTFLTVGSSKTLNCCGKGYLPFTENMGA